jgi:hypothetical protein
VRDLACRCLCCLLFICSLYSTTERNPQRYTLDEHDGKCLLEITLYDADLTALVNGNEYIVRTNKSLDTMTMTRVTRTTDCEEKCRAFFSEQPVLREKQRLLVVELTEKVQEKRGTIDQTLCEIYLKQRRMYKEANAPSQTMQGMLEKFKESAESEGGGDDDATYNTLDGELESLLDNLAKQTKTLTDMRSAQYVYTQVDCYETCKRESVELPLNRLVQTPFFPQPVVYRQKLLQILRVQATEVVTSNPNVLERWLNGNK